jgi:DNA-binding MarR family transcriptional regulator
MSTPAYAQVIGRFHHLVIRLLRQLRAVDETQGFSGPRASALSVLVFRGPQSLRTLAEAEGVKPPTMSRLVKAMQAEGLLHIQPAAGDQREIRIEVSPVGRRRMLEARSRRLDAIRRLLREASPAEMRALATVTDLLERVLG